MILWCHVPTTIISSCVSVYSKPELLYVGFASQPLPLCHLLKNNTDQAAGALVNNLFQCLPYF